MDWGVKRINRGKTGPGNLNVHLYRGTLSQSPRLKVFDSPGIVGDDLGYLAGSPVAKSLGLNFWGQIHCPQQVVSRRWLPLASLQANTKRDKFLGTNSFPPLS